MARRNKPTTTLDQFRAENDPATIIANLRKELADLRAKGTKFIIPSPDLTIV